MEDVRGKWESKGIKLGRSRKRVRSRAKRTRVSSRAATTARTTGRGVGEDCDVVVADTDEPRFVEQS